MKKILKHVIKGEKRILILLMILSLSLIFNFCVSGVSAAPGDIIYVNGSSGNDSWDGLSSTWTSGIKGPKLSIKNATGTVNSGGTVNIADGTYAGTDNTEITITKNMNIIGQSQTGTVINGTNSKWVFKIQSGLTVTIHNLTLANGDADNGGAIYNRGSLTVTDSTFTNNSAGVTGGAIYNQGTLTVTHGKFIDNSAFSSGGAIYNIGDLTLIYSNFIDSYSHTAGGAVYNIGDLTAICVDFVNNSALAAGGAIYNTGVLTAGGCNFTDNSALAAGGAIYNIGNLNLINSNFKSNSACASAGAVYNIGDMFVTGTNFTGNSAYGAGGAIFNIGDLLVTHSNFTGNYAYGAGGAIYNEGDLTAEGTNFINNMAYGAGDPEHVSTAGGAIYNDLGGDYTLKSCHFKGNIPQDIYNETDPSSGGDSNSGTTVKAASKTAPLQKTGMPLAGLISAVLMVLGGLKISKRR